MNRNFFFSFAISKFVMEVFYLFTICKCTVCALVVFYTLDFAVYLCNAFMTSSFAHLLTLLLATWIYLVDKPEQSVHRPVEVTGVTEAVATTIQATKRREEMKDTSLSDLQWKEDELQVTKNELQVADNELQVADNELQVSDNELQVSDNELQVSLSSEDD